MQVPHIEVARNWKIKKLDCNMTIPRKAVSNIPKSFYARMLQKNIKTAPLSGMKSRRQRSPRTHVWRENGKLPSQRNCQKSRGRNLSMIMDRALPMRECALIWLSMTRETETAMPTSWEQPDQSKKMENGAVKRKRHIPWTRTVRRYPFLTRTENRKLEQKVGRCGRGKQ